MAVRSEQGGYPLSKAASRSAAGVATAGRAGMGVAARAPPRRQPSDSLGRRVAEGRAAMCARMGELTLIGSCNQTGDSHAKV